MFQLMPLRNAAQSNMGLTGGEGMQMMFDLQYAPSNANIVYLSVDTSRVWKSIDGGATWLWKGWDICSHGVRSLAIHPTNPDYVWAAGFEKQSGNTTSHTGIYRTTDGGSSWTRQNSMRFEAGTGRGRIIAITVLSGTIRLWAAPRVNTTGFPSDGLHYSDDLGVNWTKLSYSFGIIFDLHPCPVRDGYLYIATDAGLLQIIQGESSPSSLGSGLPTYPRSIGVAQTPAGVVYAACGSSNIYKSTNYGSSFTAVSTGASANWNEIKCSKLDGNIAYTMTRASASYQGLWITNNGGSSWTRIANGDSSRINLDMYLQGSLGQWIECPIAIHPTESDIALIGVNGHDVISKTTNKGQDWTYSNTGYCGGRLSPGAVKWRSADDFIVSLLDFGLFRSTNGGSTFSKMSHGSVLGGNSAGSLDIFGDKIIASIGSWSGRGIVISWDNGNSWTKYEALERTDHNVAHFHRTNFNVIYAGRYRSDNNAGAWTTLSRTIYGVYPGNNDIVYSFSSGTVYRSTDKGDTWSQYRDVVPSNVKWIAVHPTNSTMIWVAAENGVYIQSGASSWTRKFNADGITTDCHNLNHVNYIAVDPGTPTTLYCGKRGIVVGPSNGLFRSTDSGGTWTRLNESPYPDPIDCWSLAVDPYSGKVYLGGSEGTYIYSEGEVLPYDYALALAQNNIYPFDYYGMDSVGTPITRTVNLTQTNDPATIDSTILIAYLISEQAFNDIKIRAANADVGVTWLFSSDGASWVEELFLESVPAESATPIFIKVRVANDGSITENKQTAKVQVLRRKN